MSRSEYNITRNCTPLVLLHREEAFRVHQRPQSRYSNCDTKLTLPALMPEWRHILTGYMAHHSVGGTLFFLKKKKF